MGLLSILLPRSGSHRAGVVAFAAMLACANSLGAQAGGNVALVNATVVDVEQGRLLPRQTILIRDSRIVQVTPAATTSIPRGATRVDLNGSFVIPGLWDMHVHVATKGPDALESSVAYYGAAFLAHGVTGVRDAGGNARLLAAMDSIGRARPGAFPRLVHAGDKIGPAANEPRYSVADIRSAISDRRAMGAGYIKLKPGFPNALFRAALAECASAGLRCTAHIPAADTSLWLTAPGRGSYEHLFNLPAHVSTVPAQDIFAAAREYNDPTLLQRVLYKLRIRKRPQDPEQFAVTVRDTTRDAGFFQRVAQSGTWFTPTLVLHHQMTRMVDLVPSATEERLVLEVVADEERTEIELKTSQDSWDLWNGIVRAMWRARVNMLAGTDFSARHVPGASLQAELVLLRDAGIPATDVLRMATLNVARFLGAADTLGTVSAGRVADLVVLRQNPLEDIAHVSDIELVVTRGHLMRRDALDSLAGVAARAGATLRGDRPDSRK